MLFCLLATVNFYIGILTGLFALPLEFLISVFILFIFVYGGVRYHTVYSRVVRWTFL